MDKKELKPIKKGSSLENTIRPQKKGLFFDNLITVEELALAFGLSPRTIKNWVSLRQIPFIQFRRRTYFLKDSIHRWLQQKEKSCQ